MFGMRAAGSCSTNSTLVSSSNRPLARIRAMAMSMPTSLPCSSSKCHGALVLAGADDQVAAVEHGAQQAVARRLRVGRPRVDQARAAAAATIRPPATPTPPAPIADRRLCPDSLMAFPRPCWLAGHLAASPGAMQGRPRQQPELADPLAGQADAAGLVEVGRMVADRRRAGARIRRRGRRARRRCWWPPAPRSRRAWRAGASMRARMHRLGLGLGEAELGRAQQVAQAGEPRRAGGGLRRTRPGWCRRCAVSRRRTRPRRRARSGRDSASSLLPLPSRAVPWPATTIASGCRPTWVARRSTRLVAAGSSVSDWNRLSLRAQGQRGRRPRRPAPRPRASGHRRPRHAACRPAASRARASRCRIAPTSRLFYRSAHSTVGEILLPRLAGRRPDP